MEKYCKYCDSIKNINEFHKQKNGKLVEIFKDPITDNGLKKSAKGLTVVYRDEKGEYYLKDQATLKEVLSDKNELKIRFKNGKFFNQTTLTKIRERINKQCTT